MGKIPRIRCPVCGMLGYLRNFVGKHQIDLFVVHYGSGGRKRGRITWEKQAMPEGYLDWLIKRLKEVIIYLESKKTKSPSLRIKQQQKPKLALPVSVKFALPIKDSQSNLLRMQMRNAPKKQLNLSYEAMPKLSLKSHQKPLLKIKTN